MIDIGCKIGCSWQVATEEELVEAIGRRAKDQEWWGL